MKKLSLLLVVLLAAGSAGLYGQMAIGTNFSISGDATATAGYDIDDEQFGFKNEFNSNIKIEFVAKQSANNSETVDMSGGWYGSIELNDFQIIIDSDEEDSTEFVMEEGGMMMDDGTESVAKKERTHLYVVKPVIVATLKNGPLWLRIFDAPTNVADKVAHIEDDTDDDDATPAVVGDYDAESNDDGEDVGIDLAGPGVMAGYKTADLSLALGITSDVPYDDDATEGSFAVSADLGVDVGPAQLELSFVQGLANEDDVDINKDDTGIGALLTTTFGDIELSAGADVEMYGVIDNPDTPVNEAMDWEAGANAKVTLTPNTTLNSNFIFSSIKTVASDVEVELADKNGLVENLSMSLKWGMFDISGGDDAELAEPDLDDEADLYVEGKLDYALEGMGGTLTPGTTVTVDQVNGANAKVGLEVRAVLTDAVPATTFGLKWATTQLVDSGNKASESGIVTVWTQIKY